MARASDISMRHFPDVSDTSFQIPLTHNHDKLTENRLEDIELDFDAFNDDEMGALDDDPFMTPLPKSKKHPPLTLSEITPRGERVRVGSSNRMESTAKGEKTRGQEMNRDEQKQPVRPVLPKKESVDDMFARRKRDNYQQMGLDLTSKSTARLRRANDAIGTKQARGETRSRSEGLQTANVVPMPHGHATDNQVKQATRVMTKRPPAIKDAGITKHKPRAPISSSTQPTGPKSILKSSKPAANLPQSTLARTLTTISHTPKAERPKWGEVVAEVQQTSQRRESSGNAIGIVGGGLIDVLVMYGEKLKGSLGFSSSSGKSTPQGSSKIHINMQPPQTTHDSMHSPSNFPNHLTAGPSSQPLTLSDLSPLKVGSHGRKNALTLSDLSPSKQSQSEDDNAGHHHGVSPMRPSKKRTSPGTPHREGKKERLGSRPEPQRPSSRSSIKTTSERGATSRPRSATKAASRPKILGPSHAANGVNGIMTHLQPRTQPTSTVSGATSTKPHLGTKASTRDLKAKSKEVSPARTRMRRAVDKEQHAPTSLTLPAGPAFASDIYRQRALEKTQREREEKAAKEKQRRTFKAGMMPYFSKPAPPARPAVRPTVPASFTFQSDARATLRNAEFEEKRKAWESRATYHALPMPNFAAMHAAHAEASRGSRIVPVLPMDVPPLTTMVRAKEREKFEAERREREMVVEGLKEMRERERAEQEEKEYREARKRTVPKAHEVPEWYKDVPKRREVG